MQISTVHKIARDTAGVLLSPIVAVVGLPIATLIGLYHAVNQCYHSYMVGDQKKEYTNYEAEKDLTQHDVKWLKHEMSRLEHEDNLMSIKSMIQALAKGLIPIVGYFWMKGGFTVNEKNMADATDVLGKAADLHNQLSWGKWHIDLLEGRLSRDSLEYQFGWNLNS